MSASGAVAVNAAFGGRGWSVMRTPFDTEPESPSSSVTLRTIVRVSFSRLRGYTWFVCGADAWEDVLSPQVQLYTLTEPSASLDAAASRWNRKSGPAGSVRSTRKSACGVARPRRLTVPWIDAAASHAVITAVPCARNRSPEAVLTPASAAPNVASAGRTTRDDTSAVKFTVPL